MNIVRRGLGVVIALLLAVAPSVSVGATGGSFGGRPALPRDDEPRSRSIFLHTIKPGQVIHEKILVSNRSDNKQTIMLYAVDAIPSNSGAFTCEQRAETVNSTGGWIKLAKQEVTLSANQVELVDFTITAPSNADVGEHNACIALENADDEGTVSGNVRIHTRSAVRVALTVPGDLKRAIAISSFGVTQHRDQQSYTVVLTNTGNVSADVEVGVRLRTVFGTTVYENGGQYPVLAAEKNELTFRNENAPFFGGWYWANANAIYDKKATTWGTENAKEPVELRTDDVLVFIWPQPLALVVLTAIFLIIVLALLYPLIARFRRMRARKNWARHTVREGETVRLLARKAGTSWKHLAKVNHIKAPYDLKTGSTIYLPHKPVKKTKKKKK